MLCDYIDYIKNNGQGRPVMIDQFDEYWGKHDGPKHRELLISLGYAYEEDANIYLTKKGHEL